MVAAVVVVFVAVVGFVVALTVGFVSFGLSLVAATAAALAAFVTSLADLTSAIVLFEKETEAEGGTAFVTAADVDENEDVSVLPLSEPALLSLSGVSLGFRIAEGGLWVIGAKGSCSEMTAATEWAMAK